METKRTPWWEWVLLALMLLGHGLLQSYLAWMNSDTIDEPGHVIAALKYTREGTFRTYNVNPPLSRYVQGLFLLDMDLDTSMIIDPKYGDRGELDVGEKFIAAQPELWRTVQWRARQGTIVFAILGGVLVWLWANWCLGRPCGLVACFLWCCMPDVLTHGHLVSPDLPGAVMALAAALAFRMWWVKPSWGRVVLAGTMLGLAMLTKFTLVLLYPVFGLCWLVLLTWTPKLWSAVWQGVVAVMVSVVVINAGYLFQEVGKPLEEIRLKSSKLAPWFPEDIDSIHTETNALSKTWWGKVPLPIPAAMLEGIDLQARDFDYYKNQNSSFFMAGRWVEGGSYFYYTYGLLVKEPLALFALLGIAAWSLWRRPIRHEDVMLLVLVPLCVLVLVSSQKSMNKHIRYVLPMIPFLVILASAIASWFRESPRMRYLGGVMGVWMLWTLFQARIDPMTYFNELAGGSRGGINHLAGSNLDWGQGAYRLIDWLNAHPDFRPVGVACYGRGVNAGEVLGVTRPPLGLENEEIPSDVAEQRKLGPHPGKFAVSVRFLQGDVRMETTAKRSYVWLRKFQPIVVLGGSVYIYDISKEEAEKVRSELGLIGLEE